MFNSFITLLAKKLPDYCIFERDVSLFGFKLFHFPALCKLNPFYSQVMNKKLEIKGYKDSGLDSKNIQEALNEINEKLEELGLHSNYVCEVPEDVTTIGTPNSHMSHQERYEHVKNRNYSKHKNKKFINPIDGFNEEKILEFMEKDSQNFFEAMIDIVEKGNFKDIYLTW